MAQGSSLPVGQPATNRRRGVHRTPEEIAARAAQRAAARKDTASPAVSDVGVEQVEVPDVGIEQVEVPDVPDEFETFGYHGDDYRRFREERAAAFVDTSGDVAALLAAAALDTRSDSDGGFGSLLDDLNFRVIEATQRHPGDAAEDPVSTLLHQLNDQQQIEVEVEGSPSDWISDHGSETSEDEEGEIVIAGCEQDEGIDRAEQPLFHRGLALWYEQWNVPEAAWIPFLEVMALPKDLTELRGLPRTPRALTARVTKDLPTPTVYKKHLTAKADKLPTSSSTAGVNRTVDIFYFKPRDIITDLLNRTRVDMYFGLAEVVDGGVTEFWQSDAWAQSIRACSGDLARTGAGAVVVPSDFIKYGSDDGFGRVCGVYRDRRNGRDGSQISLTVQIVCPPTK